MKCLMEEMPINDEGREHFYRESQGKSADKEILGRYKVMIDYFSQNPDRAATGINEKRMRILLYNDVILQKDKTLCKKALNKILNSPEAIIERQKDIGRTMTGGSIK